MLLIAWLIRLADRQPGVGAAAQRFGIVALALVTPGIHELYGIYLIALLAVGTAVAFRTGRGARWTWATAAVAAAIGFGIVYAAPGNAVRLGVAPESRDLGRTLALTIGQGAR